MLNHYDLLRTAPKKIFLLSPYKGSTVQGLLYPFCGCVFRDCAADFSVAVPRGRGGGGEGGYVAQGSPRLPTTP